MTLRKTLAAVTAVTLAVTLTACGGTGSSGTGGGETITVYSADGLATWSKTQFDAFTKSTGVNVNLVEAVSGEVVSRVEKEQSNPQADLLVTLLTERCGAETREAVKYEGQAAMGTSFEVLGKVAMQELMTDAKVGAFMAGVDGHIDPKALEALGQSLAPAKEADAKGD